MNFQNISYDYVKDLVCREALLRRLRFIENVSKANAASIENAISFLMHTSDDILDSPLIRAIEKYKKELSIEDCWRFLVFMYLMKDLDITFFIEKQYIPYDVKGNLVRRLKSIHEKNTMPLNRSEGYGEWSIFVEYIIKVVEQVNHAELLDFDAKSEFYGNKEVSLESCKNRLHVSFPEVEQCLKKLLVLSVIQEQRNLKYSAIRDGYCENGAISKIEEHIVDLSPHPESKVWQVIENVLKGNDFRFRYEVKLDDFVDTILWQLKDVIMGTGIIPRNLIYLPMYHQGNYDRVHGEAYPDFDGFQHLMERLCVLCQSDFE